MRQPTIVGALVLAGLAACGLDALGGADASAVPSDSVADGGDEARAEAPTPEETPPAASTDGGEVELTPPAMDSGAPFDAGALPTSPGPPLAYVVSGRFWAFNPTTGQWSGGIQLPAGTCPGLEDLALDAFGVLYAIGRGGNNVYRVTPNPFGCSQIGAGGSGFPKSLIFAPRGTVDAFDEQLVGYRDNGDYVRIDRKAGTLSLITAGAMSGRTVGDIANVGSKGYVVARGTGCSGDCLWEISLATGVATTAAPLGTLPVSRRVNGLAHWGGKLYSFGDPDDVFVFTPSNPAGATRVGGPPGYFDVGFVGAATRTIAPTN